MSKVEADEFPQTTASTPRVNEPVGTIRYQVLLAKVKLLPAFTLSKPVWSTLQRRRKPARSLEALRTACRIYGVNSNTVPLLKPPPCRVVP